MTLLVGWPLLGDHSVRAIFKALGTESAKVRIVGGAVRDAIAGREVGDADFATIHEPPEVIARAEAAGMKIVPTVAQ
jgi:poly(A) polymerase